MQKRYKRLLNTNAFFRMDYVSTENGTVLLDLSLQYLING